MYQPQIESFTGNKLEARAAISVTNLEYTSPVFGAMWFDCNVSTDRDERVVHLEGLKVVAAKFPDIEEEKINSLKAFLEKEVPLWDVEFSLDELLADLDTTETSIGLSPNLNNTPPEVIFTTKPSMLIVVDGEPVFREIENTGFESVVNTPFLIVREKKKQVYYIFGENHWYTSSNFDTWTHTVKVPAKLEEIAKEAIGEPEAGTGESAENAPNEAIDQDVIPEVLVRTTPAELLQSNGEPEFAPIQGTSILYMTNTADDILMDIHTQEYFILVAGRWYRSKSLSKGPWSFVEPDKVPGGFAEIPAESEMASVRSSVAGTQEAKEAVLENQIPQTAEVDRSEARLEVTYDGRPKFEPIKGTEMKYAVNTDKSVLLIENRYYCCDNAIWFEADAPTGPWIVSTAVPETVQDIPPESPVYNVRYVYIYDYTPEVVYVGYTPGYVHSYVYMGCVYYGTGYYYTPWYGAYYYPRPVTYGYSVHWNPYIGWGFSFGVSYGWMTVGWGVPYYGYWGPAGYRHGYHYGYHHGYAHGYRAGYNAGQRDSYNRPAPHASQPIASNNVYKNRAQGVARTGNTMYDPKTGNQIGTADRQARPTAQPADRANNVYTDREGNVYRKEGDSWNRVDNSATRPSTGEARPSTGQARPSTGEARPSTGETRPSTGQPSTRPSQPSAGQPSTRPSQPSTGRPSVGQPSTRPSQPSAGQPSARPSLPSYNLNSDYDSRNRGAERSQQYNQNRSSYQYSRPSGTSASRPTASPSRPAARPSGGGGGGARRR
jgi:hypothetical protein